MTPDQVIAELTGALPPATLVLGPGAWPLVGQAAGPDWLLKFDLSASDARDVCESVWLLPCGELRVVALCLDKASQQVQNMLLKILEEPPDGTCFVLAAEALPLPTVTSRCRVLVLSGGAAEEVVDQRDKAAVATAVRAARTGQTTLLAQNLKGWLPAQARLLGTWAAEAASGRWRVFSPDAVPGVSSGQALRLLTELARYPGARLGTLAALDAVFSQG